MNKYFLSFVVLVLFIVSFNCVAMNMPIENMHKEHFLDRELYSTEKEVKFLVPRDLKQAEDSLWYFIETIIALGNKSTDGELHVYAPAPLSLVVKSFTEFMEDLLTRADEKDKAAEEQKKIANPNIYNRLHASLQNFEWAVGRSIVAPNNKLYFLRSDEISAEKVCLFMEAQGQLQNQVKLKTRDAIVRHKGMTIWANIMWLNADREEFSKKLVDVHNKVRSKRAIASKKISFKHISTFSSDIK